MALLDCLFTLHESHTRIPYQHKGDLITEVPPPP